MRSQPVAEQETNIHRVYWACDVRRDEQGAERESRGAGKGPHDEVWGEGRGLACDPGLGEEKEEVREFMGKV